MKTEKYTCDICGHETDGMNVFEATLKVEGLRAHEFHVCRICYGETPKGVFQKAFNALFRLLRMSK